MLKYIRNSNGVAFVVVMLVLSVSLLIIFFMVNFLNSESKMTYVNINRNRASKIAETGADLAINEWINYINNQHDPANCPYGVLTSININTDSNDFKTWLDNKMAILQTTLQGTYSNNTVLITTDYSTNTLDPYDVNNSNILTITIKGSYNNIYQTYKVKLGYYSDGNYYSYKGSK